MAWQISIQGRVQGVGFRPFVWRAAVARGLKGWVANGLEGVVVHLEGDEAQALELQHYIESRPPEMALLDHISLKNVENEPFLDSFVIRHSDQEGLPKVLLPPDVAICPACRRDLMEPGNRRQGYAFTTCTVCGPRYSVITGLPYDRPLTTMRDFPLCAVCRAEYEDPGDRRYYAQTNSCPDCGITLRLFAAQGAETAGSQEDLLDRVVAHWQSGAIVAIKGIGGYLLTCDATLAAAVATLRARKQRPTKPFALMYPDPACLAGDAEMPDEARQWLESPAAPIVLLERKAQPASGLDTAGIAPGLSRIGAMLPYAPLFVQLLQRMGKPIVATSGNLSGAPLIYEDEVALRDLAGIADYVLTHNRPIVMPQDDSVVSVRPYARLAPAVILRRGRGMAPACRKLPFPVPEAPLLAVGADLKSTLALSQHGLLNVSQYLGDLADFDTRERFEKVLNHLSALYRITPERVAGDLHPAYFTTQLGQALAAQWQVPWIQVQHHKAHFAAVLAENGLINAGKQVLGVIWDGTGWGEDGQIWGGEFFVYAGHAEKDTFCRRCAHLDPFPVLIGDKMAREPRLSALALAPELPALRQKFTDTEWNLYRKMCARPDLRLTSSMGRLFDAVACLLGLADKVSYEGEAALLLENLARQCRIPWDILLKNNPLDLKITLEKPLRLDTKALFQQLDEACRAGVETSLLAAAFHLTLIQSIRQVAEHVQIRDLAFSGGVFQNTLLLDLAEYLLSPDYTIYTHHQFSPNDENIAFGQWVMISVVV